MLSGENQMDNMAQSDTTAEQNMTDGNRRNSYIEVVIEVAARKASVLVGDSKGRQRDKALNKGEDVVVCFP